MDQGRGRGGGQGPQQVIRGLCGHGGSGDIYCLRVSGLQFGDDGESKQPKQISSERAFRQKITHEEKN